MTDNPGLPPERPPRVLLVEDEEDLARNLEDLLRLDGFDVMSTRSGARALEMVRRWRFDAVVLDLVAAGDADGFEVCRALRSDPATDRLVILMITGPDDVRTRTAGPDAGADDYVIKPVIAREVAVRLRALLDDRRGRVAEGRQQRRAAIDQLAAAVGHEIDNPLAAALGRLDLLLSSELPADVRSQLAACQRDLVRIQDIVARLGDTIEDRTAPPAPVTR